MALENHVMSQPPPFPEVYLARHGETAWSITRQHTGHSDIPLTAAGEDEARSLGERLAGAEFAFVATSPLKRAKRTATLAGFPDAVDLPDLMEWDYGPYDGLTTAQIKTHQSDWQIFRDGCPGGESVAAAAARADRLIELLRTKTGRTLVFSHGHFLRMLTARWLGLPPSAGRCFILDTTSLSVLGYEHSLEQPVIRLWNDFGRLHT